MPVASNPMENSGSLTGHILAQGWDHGPDTNRRSNAKVAVAMLIVLVAIIGASVVFLLTFGSDFSDWIGGIFGG
jgi:predicted benzoate:H+ symporter BenE